MVWLEGGQGEVGEGVMDQHLALGACTPQISPPGPAPPPPTNPPGLPPLPRRSYPDPPSPLEASGQRSVGVVGVRTEESPPPPPGWCTYFGGLQFKFS